MFRPCSVLQNWKKKKSQRPLVFLLLPPHTVSPSLSTFCPVLLNPQQLHVWTRKVSSLVCNNPSPKTLSDHVTSSKYLTVPCGLKNIVRSPWLRVWGPLGRCPLAHFRLWLPTYLWCPPCFSSCLVLNVRQNRGHLDLPAHSSVGPWTSPSFTFPRFSFLVSKNGNVGNNHPMSSNP